ncbi:hypothetical protein FHS31_000787 [Sphingomonas vulcanisoli]|uniref:Uncharacterized protein n=1 Tax=Sphingomonas vulcanisoli TaxID=1658060 RepID=A0ABX0TP52_9SPHN|nr:hypothetical protein [Sphingomonas vulcanisoli]NIJ07191.1 hypothetical protein [Sphingomonas vulcanisoli]
MRHATSTNRDARGGCFVRHPDEMSRRDRAWARIRRALVRLIIARMRSTSE